MSGVTIPFPFLLCGCCAPKYADTCFSFPFLLVMLTDAMRSLDVSSSRDCGHCLITCHRFAYSFLSSCLPYPAYASYLFQLCRLVSCPRLRYTHMFAGRLVSLPSRFFLRPVFYPSFYLLFTYPTGRYFCLVLLRALRLFVLVFTLRVYITGWRWDDPHLQSTLQPP